MNLSALQGARSALLLVPSAGKTVGKRRPFGKPKLDSKTLRREALLM
jgi:hypothetical protein